MGVFNKIKRKKKNRVMIIGLDGVPYSLIQELKKKNVIKNMSAIFDNGYLGKMEVCIPEISSVSWSSFMTGTQSGEHDIYGFMDFEPGTYKMIFPNYKNLKAPTLWDDLEKKGKKSIVINMPATYPAREINGALISGFVAVDLEKSVYPKSFLKKLNEINYRIDLDLNKSRQDHTFLFNDLDKTLKSRERCVNLLWDEIEWDLLAVVVTGTDRMMHFAWDAYEDQEHDLNNKFINYFKKVDDFVGRMYERFVRSGGSKNEENIFFMLSDHGFTKIKSEVYLNYWLRENGYLSYNKSNPKSIMDIGSGTKAFVIDPSRVYINLKEKYPMGAVAKSEYENIRKELKEEFENLKYDDGDKIIKRVYLKEELYQGPYIDKAPDLVLLSHHGYDLKGMVNSNKLFGRTVLQGMHTQDDAFFFSSNNIKCNSIFDAKKIIIESLI